MAVPCPADTPSNLDKTDQPTLPRLIVKLGDATHRPDLDCGQQADWRNVVRMEPWTSTTPGLLTLPSGRMIRGRGLLQPQPKGEQPTFGIYLLEDPPPHFDWESKWLKWQDFGLPYDDRKARNLLKDAWSRLDAERVEVACLGGIGRTGTALSCIAILDGVPAEVAVRYVRNHYRGEAVETVDQERYIERFA